MFEPAQVREVRRSLGLTQAQLAERARVSQSFVAKLESGMLDPSLSSMKRISSALEGMRQATEKKVSEVMHRGVVSVSSVDSLRTAAQCMCSHCISQLPVLVRGRSVGLVTEADLLEAMMSERTMSIQDVMKDSPPVIAPSAGVRAVRELLRWWPLVLVGERGRIVGVVTKSDMIGAL